MKGEVMEVRNETKTLFLVPGAGKDVRLYFNQKKNKARESEIIVKQSSRDFIKWIHR